MQTEYVLYSTLTGVTFLFDDYAYKDNNNRQAYSQDSAQKKYDNFQWPWTGFWQSWLLNNSAV